ncbi:hypothetical protein BGZ58_008987 [Dissophora ornata]|nr:hypothetical protein BGZ58_008987 [Dissophora ornata]
MADDQPKQAFCAYNSRGTIPISDIINIDTRLDAQTNSRIVLLRDIERVFKSVQYIKNGSNAVSYLMDDNFEDLKPLRICYQPGAVLKVIVENSDNSDKTLAGGLVEINAGSSFATSHDLSSLAGIQHGQRQKCANILAVESPSHPGLVVVDDYSEETSLLDSQFLRIPSPSFVEIQPAETDLAIRSQFMEPGSRLRRHSFSGLQDPYVQAIVSSQMMQTASIKEVMSDRFDRIQVDMDSKNNALQDQLVYMQERYQELQLQSQKEILQKQREVIHMQQQMSKMQQQALDRLALIQNRVLSVVSQTYELHEYPIPRLFIILPKEKRKRDKFGKPFAKLFRLYFLCECGAHTKMEGSKISHEIHLAKHDGYDIQKPDEFFEKYGSYVLTMLQMVKYGFIAAGIAVPVLGHLKLIEGIDSVQDNLDFTKLTIGGLVDESITFIQDQATDTLGTLKTTANKMELENQEVLEGADLRQLQSYLSINDKSRVLGNLYRIVTSNGHVKWVCMDHHRDLYHQTAVKELKDSIEANRGEFVEEEGKVNIRFTSNILATQFFEVMVKARCVQDLSVWLNWEVTAEDIQRFSSAVTKANVVRLELRGCGYGLLTDPDSSLFLPILRLMTNGKLRSMHIETSSQHFLIVDVAAMESANELRELTIEIPAWKEAAQLLVGIVKNCQSLASLNIGNMYSHDVCLLVYRNLPLFRNLKSLRIRDGRYKIAVGISQGKFDDFKLVTMPASSWEDDSVQELFLGGHITVMHLNFDEGGAFKERYSAIVQSNPKLFRLSFQTDMSNCLDILELTISARQQLLLRGQSPSSCELHGINYNDDWDIRFSIDFVKGSPLFSRHIHILLKQSATINDDVRNMIRQKGWSIETLNATEAFNFDMNTAAALLDSSTAAAGSKLVSLNLASVSLISLECLDRIIARSQSLKDLHFTLSLDCERLQEKSAWLIGRQGKSLTGLALLGSKEDSWTTEIVQWFPRRSDLPKLELFEIRDINTTQYEEFFARWVADMVSAPPPISKPSTSSPSSESSLLDVSTLTGPISDTSRHLKAIKIEGVTSTEEQWSIVFKAIDFTALEELEFKGIEFSVEQFQAFVDCIPDTEDREVLPLKKLYFHYVRGTSTTSDDLKAIMAQLKEKAPLVVMST